MSLGLLILGLVLFILLVVVHELGHFWVARRNGVEIEEFGLFFPPRLWSKRVKRGWTFSINLIPLGGFVRLKGEHDSDSQPHSYGAAKLSSKAKILIAGVVMNLIAAYVLLTLLAWVGMPQLVNNQYSVKSNAHTSESEVLIGLVEANSPAAKAGLKSGDELIAIGIAGQKTTEILNANTLPNITHQYAGKKVNVEYIRNKKTATITTTLLSQKTVDTSDKTNNPKGYLGVSPTQYVLQRSTWSAPIVAGGLIAQFTVLTVHGLGSALAGLLSGNTAKAESQVAGPVGIFVLLKNGSLLGYQFVLMIVAVISLSLAIMNTLPIPALDGGKLFVTLVARVFHKRLSENLENWIYGTSFALIMVLVVLITIVDVRRNF